MIHSIDGVLFRQSRVSLTLSALLLTSLIAAVDYVTGFELSFSIFYLAPVSIAGWYMGRLPALSFCVVAAITWYAVDQASGHGYSHWSIPIWNGGVRFGFFVITALLLVRLRTALDAQRSLAERDGLTGLMNARAFMKACVRLFQLAERHEHPVCLGYVDLDGFKSVNDSLGHSRGDAVLQAVGGMLGKLVRSSDLVARLGGDEFAICAPETGFEGATKLFGKLHEDLVNLAAKNGWPIGFSIGVAVFPSAAVDPEEAVQFADALMYRVKYGEKNHVLIEQYGTDGAKQERHSALAD